MSNPYISPESFDPDVISFDDDLSPMVDMPEPADEPMSNPTPRAARPEPAPEPVAAEEKKSAAAKRKQAKEAKTSRRIDWNIDRRWKIFLGVVLFLFAGYLLVACISYFPTAISDQSAVENVGIAQLADEGNRIDNEGGPLGAVVADKLINRWLGLGAFIMIFWLGMCSLALLGVKKINFLKFTFSCWLTAIALSIVVGFITWSANLNSVFYWGGLEGLTLNAWLYSVAGWWGAAGVALLMTAAVALLFLKELTAGGRKVVGYARTWSASRREGREAAAEEREARRAEKARKKAEKEAAKEAKKEAAKPKEPEFVVETPEVEQHEPEISTIGGGITEPEVPNVDVPFDVDEPEPDIDDEPVAELEPLTTIGGMEIEIPTLESAEGSDVPEEKDDKKGGSAIEGLPPYDHKADLSHYQMPSLDLLRDLPERQINLDVEEQEENKERIIKTLLSYDVAIASIKATVGPTVTLYEITPAEGVRINKIRRLEDDIALQLAALGIRIIAPIPGKGTIGLEVPNRDPQVVSIRSILGSKKFAETTMELPLALGCTIQNEVFIADLAKIPHLLVAGTTGTGKSVGLNTIIASLLYKKHPSELKFVLVDPKMVEFSLYSKLENHYMAKLPDDGDVVITDPLKVIATLNSLCVEMDNRYMLLKDASVRTIKEYNDKFSRRLLSPEKGHFYMPYIVVIIDEFADLITTAGKEIETPIARIAQKARAVGIHMILATQRPDARVITGVIRANFPGRIAFKVASLIDSRIVMDRPGANQLIGRGDMLFSDSGKIERVQCAFIDTPEVQNLVDAISHQQSYGCPYELPEFVPEGGGGGGGDLVAAGRRDPLFEEAAMFIMSNDTASVSSLQRRYEIGYNRAGKIMDQLEAAGVVGPALGSKPRAVLMTPSQFQNLLAD